MLWPGPPAGPPAMGAPWSGRPTSPGGAPCGAPVGQGRVVWSPGPNYRRVGLDARSAVSAFSGGSDRGSVASTPMTSQTLPSHSGAGQSSLSSLAASAMHAVPILGSLGGQRQEARKSPSVSSWSASRGGGAAGRRALSQAQDTDGMMQRQEQQMPQLVSSRRVHREELRRMGYLLEGEGYVVQEADWTSFDPQALPVHPTPRPLTARDWTPSMLASVPPNAQRASAEAAAAAAASSFRIYPFAGQDAPTRAVALSPEDIMCV